MLNSEGKKSPLRKSKTSLQGRKKSDHIVNDAAEQRKLDDQNGKQDERYKTLVENIPCAAYSAFPGETGPTTFMSKNWKDWTGYSTEELYQDPEAWPKCIYPDDREKAVNAYIEACRNEAPYNLDYRIVHRETGQVRYVRDQGLLSKDSKGTLIRVDGIVSDITELKTSENELVKYRDHLEELVKERTAELEKANEVLEQQAQERKKAEESLRESETRYKAVVDNAQEGIVVVQDKKLRFINPMAMSMLDYTEEELMSQSFIEFVHPDDREQVMDIHLKRFKGEEVSETYEFKIVNKQGNARWTENNGILIEWEGRPATLNFLRDITEQKRTEMELKKQKYYLEKAQDIGRIGTWELDIEKNILVWTDENYRIFGVPEGIELTYEIFLNCVHPDDREYVDKKWKAALNKEPYDIEHRLWVDGEVKWVREKAEVEFDEKGNCVRGIGFTQDITERKKAEELLQQSTNLLRESQEVARLGHYIFDALTGLWGSSDILDTIFGIGGDYPRGVDGWLQIVHRDQRDEMSTYFSEVVLGQGQPFDREYRITRVSDHQVRWVHGLGRLEFDKEGKPTRMFGTIQDITERKQAEKELKESEERFRSFSNAAFEGIVITKDGKFVDANATFTNLFGYEPEEIAGIEVQMLVAPEDRNMVTENIRSGNEKPYEHKALCKDGSVLDIEVCGRSILYKGQQCRITAIRDITGYKQAHKTLRDNEIRFRQLVENIHEVFWMENADGTELLYVSPAYEEIWGRLCEEFYKNPRVWTDAIHPDDRERVKDAFAKGRLDGTYSEEFRIIRPDGTLRWIWDRNVVIRDESGNTQRIAGIAENITERKRAAEQLLDYQAKLKSLASQLSVTEERERRRIATELHDQIGQSLVFTKIKLDELHNSATSGELTRALDEICNNIGQIIKDTRTLTFDLSSPVLNELGFEAAVTGWLEEQIQEKHGIKTEFEDDEKPKPLDDDIQALLFRNVRELLVNVVKHANAQNVKVSVRKVDEFINISVEDNGKGFDPTEVASKATFGLFSIRERLEQLGGQFEIDSKTGRGSKFTMTAPLKQA